MSNFKVKEKGLCLIRSRKSVPNPSKVNCSFSTQFDQVGWLVATELDHVDPPTPTMLVT